MSGPAVVGVLQFVGTAMAAKTAIEGLKEGNLMKAVIGGVGAYIGASSLATAAETSVLNAGESAASQAATTAAGNEAAKSTLGAFSMETPSNTIANGISNTASRSVVTVGLQAAPSMSGAPAAGAGLINSPINLWKSDDMLKYGALQLGGGILAGSAQQDWEEKMIADRNKREDESRERRGYWAPSPTVGKTRFNPRTGQFEEVAI